MHLIAAYVHCMPKYQCTITKKATIEWIMQASATENYLLFSTWNSTRLTKEKWGVLTQKKVKNYYITDITCLWWNSNLDRPCINTSIPFSPNLTFNWLCKHSNLRDKNTIPHFSWLFILYQLFTKKKLHGINQEFLLRSFYSTANGDELLDCKMQCSPKSYSSSFPK